LRRPRNSSRCHGARADSRALPAPIRSHQDKIFRFVAGSDASATGRTRTAPAADSQREQLRFAWFTCQDWLINHWDALDLLAAEDDLDFTVHVGDYVYETVGAKFQAGVAEPAHQAIRLPDGVALGDGSVYANTLDDYRTLYRTYRGDARLQTVHARFPLIAIWDDHEFSDDCWQDHQTYTNANTQQTARRRGASQAWVEYMPVDFGGSSNCAPSSSGARRASSAPRRPRGGRTRSGTRRRPGRSGATRSR